MHGCECDNIGSEILVRNLHIRHAQKEARHHIAMILFVATVAQAFRVTLYTYTLGRAVWRC